MEATFGGIALTGPTPSEHLGLVEMPSSLIAEVIPILRAEQPLLRARGNESLQVRLRCVRRYASLLGAMEARAVFMRSLPRSGQLVLTQASGGFLLTLTADGAVRAPSASPILMGRSLEWDFVFLANRFVSTVTEVASFLRDQSGEFITDSSGSPIYH